MSTATQPVTARKTCFAQLGDFGVIESIDYTGGSMLTVVSRRASGEQCKVSIDIEDWQKCCEVFGCVLSWTGDCAKDVKSTDEFIGKTIAKVSHDDPVGLVEHYNNESDTRYPSDAVCREDDYTTGVGTNTMFVTITTTDGLSLHLGCYNCHNGYYSHGCTARGSTPDGVYSYSEEL